jgi:hypothetical protein
MAEKSVVVCNRLVLGSNPRGGVFNKEITQMIEFIGWVTLLYLAIGITFLIFCVVEAKFLGEDFVQEDEWVIVFAVLLIWPIVLSLFVIEKFDRR